ncbi:MAG: tetratricopeptide repeat protein [Acidobacteria bacterium]|nr:tetratricopeptide repeat protein [Acidobacteriota bacterium]
MKRTERQHLKENEVQNFVRVARELYESRRNESTLIIAFALAAGVAALGYYGWREHVQSRATTLLAEAMTVQDARIGPPPAPGTPASGLYFPTERERAQAALTKFKIAADAYPSSDAGIYARFQLAATYMALGTPAQAAAAYQEVIAKAGTSIYGQMARLGLAGAQARAGQYDQAISAYKDLAERRDGPLPVDGILMQLGRAYLDAGKRTEAQQTFNRVVEEFPESPFNGDARKELDNLKKT